MKYSIVLIQLLEVFTLINGHYGGYPTYHVPSWHDSARSGLEEFYKWKEMAYDGVDSSKGRHKFH